MFDTLLRNYYRCFYDCYYHSILYVAYVCMSLARNNMNYGAWIENALFSGLDWVGLDLLGSLRA